MHLIIKVLFLVLIARNCFGEVSDSNDTYKWPTVGISVLVRNKAHTLPYFISCILNLDYPKDRLYLWIYTDYNQDNSEEVVEFLSKNYMHHFNRIYVVKNNTKPHFSDERNSVHWTPQRFQHIIELRESGLQFARKMWADYMLMLDADVYLTNPATLKVLVRKKLDIVAPMLVSDGLYSNFWSAMTYDYYYKRVSEYKTILHREVTGCFEVPMVHSAILIHLRPFRSEVITYDPEKAKNYDGPKDDVITFAINARNNNIKLHVCNDVSYGYVQVPLEVGDELPDDKVQLLNVKLEAISRGTPFPLDHKMERFVNFPERTKLGVDEIYMINLDRRVERRVMMELSFKELGMDVNRYTAIDGRKLNLNDLRKHFIRLMPNYEDPYHKRPMKAGEVGCFLSHYYIWKEIVQRGHGITLVLEDDIHFAPYFLRRFESLLQEMRYLDWDLVYLGRKVLQDGDEVRVTAHITRPLYSYWTLGYLISERGAAKLLDANPLANMLPVDEFLPIMFDQHPNDTWKTYFPDRNIHAFSASPLLVHPTHYTGQEGYVSDTENSSVITNLMQPTNSRNEL